MEVRDVSMDFLYGESFTESSPEAYERLILDVLIGDATLFPRNKEIEYSWRIIDRLEEFCRDASPTRTGPATGGRPRPSKMLARDGRAVAAAVRMMAEPLAVKVTAAERGPDDDAVGHHRTDVVKALAASGAQRGHWPSQACSPSSSSR